MRKYLALILSAVFVLGFAASAFAIHAEIPAESQAVVTKGVQVYLGGDIRIRGEFDNNNTDFTDDKGDHASYYDQRIRLWVDAQVTPNTRGFVMIEGAKGFGPSTAWTWGDSSSGAKGSYNKGDTKRGDLSILEAWILNTGSGLLGIPAGIKIGHMPLALGNKIFFDHTLFGDDAIVLFADPTKELHVGVLTIKLQEGDVKLNDDSNVYVALFNYRTKEFGLSGDVTYLDDQAVGPKGLHFWNFGLRGDVNVAGFGIKADAEVQTGKAENALATGGDLKFSGYALDLGVSYTVSGIKLEAEYLYGSGDKPGTDKFEQFVSVLSNTQHYTFVYDYRTINAGKNALTGGTQTAMGASNTQYIKAGLSGSLMKDLSGELFYYNLRANKVASGSKSIGNEIDAKLTYKIDKNLNYWVEGGYLITGNFWKTVTGGTDPDNAYAIRHGIQLTF